MTITSSRRRFLAGATVIAVGGIAGCTGDGGNSGDPSGDDSDGGDPDDGTSSDGTQAATSPEEVVREMLRATASGDRETVRRLTVEGHSLRQVGEIEDLTIESVERHSAQSYAERTGASVSQVETALTDAVDRGYDDATIVSYTASTAQYDDIQRDYILVLDGDQWLMFDFGRLPE